MAARLNNCNSTWGIAISDYIGVFCIALTHHPPYRERRMGQQHRVTAKRRRRRAYLDRRKQTAKVAPVLRETPRPKAKSKKTAAAPPAAAPAPPPAPAAAQPLTDAAEPSTSWLGRFARPELWDAHAYDARHHDFAWQHRELARLMSNECPLPPDEVVIAAATAAMREANLYPNSG